MIYKRYNMNNRYFRLLIVNFAIISIIVWSGCISQSSIESDVIEATLDDPFQLQINETAELESENLQLRFSSVTEDSRCATGAQCVWAGRGTVLIDVLKNGNSIGAFSLSTEGGLSNTTFEDYTLKLTALNPYPIIDEPINLADYTATLVVNKV